MRLPPVFAMEPARKFPLILLSAVCLLSFASAGEIFVSPQGNDAHPGTQEQPFASLERARDEIRRRREAGDGSPAMVQIRGGTYGLSRTLTLGPRDSGTEQAPVVYQAFPGERPILSGGLEIGKFQPHQGHILRADAKGQGWSGDRLRQIFFQGRRQVWARYPNLDPARPFESGWTFVDGEAIPAERLGATGARRMLRVAASDLRSWARPQEGEVNIFPSHEWWNNIAAIAACDREQRILTLGRNCSYDIQAGDRFAIQGLREELDAPGEWHLDSENGVLDFWPPAVEPSGAVLAPEEIRVVAPRLRTLLELGPGTAHVTFRGLTWEVCEGTAIVFQGANHCRVEGCTIRNAGDYHGSGVSLAGGAGNGVAGCDIADTGSHGISLSGGDEKTLTAAGNYADNNDITRTGAFYKQGCGVYLGGTGNRVTRNHLHDLPRFGILFGGQNHLIEGNHIHHVSLETMDTAGIYGNSLNWLSGHGCVVRHNFVHDVVGRSGKAGEWRSPYFAWGIYLDWTAMGITVTGNVVVRAPRAGIHLHDGRDNRVENNVFVECGTGRRENSPTSQVEFNGWDLTYGWWQREIGNWSVQYDSIKDQPAWKAVPSLRDPRRVHLPDGRTMQRNYANRNILCWSDPQPQAYRFRNLSFAHNGADANLLWHGGLPIGTGSLKAGEAKGADLAPPNAGFEQAARGGAPAGWSWHSRPSEADTAVICQEQPHAGDGCLRLEGIPQSGEARAAKGLKDGWQRIPSLKSGEVVLEPGKTYSLSAWLRGGTGGLRVELGVQSYRKDAYTWQQVETFTVGPEWTRCETVFRFPEPDRGGHPEMKGGYVRIRLPAERGLVWADEVQVHEVALLDEWEAWQALGMDRHSLVADPLFRDAARDDYRLRAESPAWKLGFEPIPFDRIGTYADEFRARGSLER